MDEWIAGVVQFMAEEGFSICFADRIHLVAEGRLDQTPSMVQSDPPSDCKSLLINLGHRRIAVCLGLISL